MKHRTISPFDAIRRATPRFLAVWLASFLIISAAVAEPAAPAPQPGGVRRYKLGAAPAKRPSAVRRDRRAKEKGAKPAAAPVASKSVARIAAAPVKAEVESVRRRVEVQAAGENAWASAKKKTPLRASDKMRTGGASVARVKLGDGSKMLVLQNSELQFENLTNVSQVVRLLKGRARVIVTGLREGTRFQVKTPVGVASVRGTDFEVGFDDGAGEMTVDVHNGLVGVGREGVRGEVLVNPGEQVRFGAQGVIGDPVRTGAFPVERGDVKSELQSDRSKDAILAMAAEEMRVADYQTGKSIMDVDGSRVRIEEYIMRPAANQFKLVALNERADRFDYFTYLGTFNKSLPDDLSIALKQVGGKLGTDAPEFYLTQYEMVLSNTKDQVKDSATGGHLVQISFDGTTYTLSDPTDPSNTRTVDAAALQGDGSYKIYNPVRDGFSFVTADKKDEAVKVAVLDGGTYRNLASGDTYWKTRYNDYTSHINTSLKTAYAKNVGVTNTLAVDLDATFSERPITVISERPSGSDRLHSRLSLYYNDGSKTVYDTYIIDDEGNVASKGLFADITSSADYRNLIETLNYQQRISGDGMSDEINLVIDPRIGTMSGLIQ